MTTQNITLTKTPTQITDGSTSTLFMQSLNRREFCLVVSDSTPSSSIKPHTAQEINLNGTVKVWAWSNAEVDIPVVITKF
jgi:hypothetical protein